MNNFTSLLIRRDRSVRVLAAGVSEYSALQAINQNWQNRNHPENVHNYILVASNGGTSVAKVVSPEGKATYTPPVTTKRPAIV